MTNPASLPPVGLAGLAGSSSAPGSEAPAAGTNDFSEALAAFTGLAPAATGETASTNSETEKATGAAVEPNVVAWIAPNLFAGIAIPLLIGEQAPPGEARVFGSPSGLVSTTSTATGPVAQLLSAQPMLLPALAGLTQHQASPEALTANTTTGLAEVQTYVDSTLAPTVLPPASTAGSMQATTQENTFVPLVGPALMSAPLAQVQDAVAAISLGEVSGSQREQASGLATAPPPVSGAPAGAVVGSLPADAGARGSLAADTAQLGSAAPVTDPSVSSSPAPGVLVGEVDPASVLTDGPSSTEALAASLTTASLPDAPGVGQTSPGPRGSGSTQPVAAGRPDPLFRVANPATLQQGGLEPDGARPASASTLTAVGGPFTSNLTAADATAALAPAAPSVQREAGPTVGLPGAQPMAPLAPISNPGQAPPGGDHLGPDLLARSGSEAMVSNAQPLSEPATSNLFATALASAHSASSAPVTTLSGLAAGPSTVDAALAQAENLAALRSAVAEQVVERANLLRFPDRTEMTIELRPPQLGLVRLHLVDDAGSLVVRFDARDAPVQQMLSSAVDQLSARLGEQGHSVQVELQWEQQAEQKASDRGDEGEGAPDQNQETDESVAAATPTLRAAGARGGRIDVRA